MQNGPGHQGSGVTEARWGRQGASREDEGAGGASKGQAQLGCCS